MTQLQRAYLMCFVAAASGCTSLQRNYDVVLPTAAPTSTGTDGGATTASPTGSTASPGPCATQNPAATVVVAMVSFITATPDPAYGTINGYAVTSNGSAPVVASPIDATVGNIVQFVNGEETGTTPIMHSAVAFPNATAFPATPYTFSGTSANPVATQIVNAPWSTGLIAPGCYSQSFNAPLAGTFYFGDETYYNLDNVRDVIVVGTSSTSSVRSATSSAATLPLFRGNSNH